MGKANAPHPRPLSRRCTSQGEGCVISAPVAPSAVVVARLLTPVTRVLPLLAWPMTVERVLADGRRVQRFERGRLVTQPGAAAPWDVVQRLLVESAASGA